MNAAGSAPGAPPRPKPHICICICTCQRPELLRRLLEAVTQLQTENGAFSFSCVVVDNDELGSARSQAERFAREQVIPLIYDIEPCRNFGLVRNRAIALARGDFIAFVDDDEVPVPLWLVHLLATQQICNADGVLGPVRPYFDVPPPSWVLKGKLCDRPVHPTGMVMRWNQCRTGNVLLKSTLFDKGGLQFDAAYATGGEDVDFFKRAIGAGHRFIWCEEAPAYELVSPERFRKSYFLKRGLLQGGISLRYAVNNLTLSARVRIGLQSLAALLLYALALPLLFLGGFHLVMKYLIKGSHHLGRLSALAGICLVRKRDF